jgi:hypothetical protein
LAALGPLASLISQFMASARQVSEQAFVMVYIRVLNSFQVSIVC